MLLGFLYIILVCGVAYGVVSSSLTMYNSLEFTAQNVSKAVLYRPYWLLYGNVDEDISNVEGLFSFYQ